MSQHTTAKFEIMRVLASAPGPLAVHELGIVGYSENALATRVSELHNEGRIVGRVRAGEQFKEWRLATPEESSRLAERRKGERRASAPPLHGTVSAVQPLLTDAGHETILVTVPAGKFQPGQEVRVQ